MNGDKLGCCSAKRMPTRQILRTPTHPKVAALALLGWAVSLLAPLSAEAGPSLYANSFVVSTSQADCLKNTRDVLIRAGMKQQDITSMTYKNDAGRDVQNGWSADHPTENISVVFECDARNGMGAIAVSGVNNDATYEVYSRLWDLWMK